jgi:hypothetical protein
MSDYDSFEYLINPKLRRPNKTIHLVINKMVYCVCPFCSTTNRLILGEDDNYTMFTCLYCDKSAKLNLPYSKLKLFMIDPHEAKEYIDVVVHPDSFYLSSNYNELINGISNCPNNFFIKSNIISYLNDIHNPQLILKIKYREIENKIEPLSLSDIVSHDRNKLLENMF